MQYIPCNSALLAQKTLFLTQKGTVFQIYKSFGIWEDPPPCWEKFSNNIVFFFRAYLKESEHSEFSYKSEYADSFCQNRLRSYLWSNLPKV